MIRLAAVLTPLLLAAGAAQAQDPHAGHGAGATAPVQDPHTDHVPPAPPDRQAGHDMAETNNVQDPHANRSVGAAGPPDVATSADNPGRPAEPPPPPGALSGPAYAAETVFGAAEMARGRQLLARESGDVRTTAVIVDRLEAGLGEGEETFLWDAQGWTGGDINRFWWKSEGEGDFDGGLQEGQFQALYSRAITPFWDLQAGLRQDYRRHGDDPTHLVLAVQGLAPHWWEMNAAAFVSTDGDVRARLEAEYDQRITQRLILQPRFEIALSASDIPQLEIGSGLGSVAAGLRLRYEIRREFAPYAGVEWTRAFGETRDLLEAAGGEAETARFVLGLRVWF